MGGAGGFERCHGPTSQKLTEILNGQPRGPDNHSHGDRVDGVVSGDRQHADAVGHHNMLALAQNAEAGLFQSPHCMQS